MSPSAALLVCFVASITSFDIVHSNSVEEEALASLPQAIRQSPSYLVQVLNSSAEGILESNANVTNISLADIENDNLTQSLQMRYRERKKQERIITIQAQILHRLRMDRQPNISSSLSEEERRKILEIYDRIQNGNNGYVEMAAQGVLNPFLTKLQSFYPSCSIPNNTDKPLWESAEAFRIFYDTPFNRYAGTKVNILLAKLRLYKVTGNADPNFIGWDANQENSPRYNQLESLVNSRAANGINVNIYQFLKPLRPNRRGRKRLIDQRTLDIEYEGWVEFNVMESLNCWLHRSNKNFGFDVQVEDAYGNKLNPNLYFQNINCSGEIPAQDSPFPNIMELHPEMGENESSLLDNETYPTLDLQTAEIPRDFTNLEALSDQLNNDRVIRRRSSREDDDNTCRGEEIYVTFEEMGLDDYIVWPSGVLWTFCEGNCDSSHNTGRRQDSFYSTWMNRLFRIKTKETASKCVATTRESIPVILNGGETEEFETVFENIVPTSCGCRLT